MLWGIWTSPVLASPLVAPKCFQREIAVSMAGRWVEVCGLSRQVCCYTAESAWKHLGAPRRRRPRGKVWLLVRLSNFVRPHKSLRQGRTPRTPALAIGLTDHGWNSRAYLWLPGHPEPVLTQQRAERMARLLTPALQDHPFGRTQAHTQTKTRAEHEKEAAPLPKAA